MKIALVAQNATPLRPRTGSGPDSDDIGLSELTRKLAGHGHQVTVYAQKNDPSQPDHAELHAGVRVEHINRSEEHTSELQSLRHLVCRLLLEKNTATPRSKYSRLHRPLDGESARPPAQN